MLITTYMNGVPYYECVETYSDHWYWWHRHRETLTPFFWKVSRWKDAEGWVDIECGLMPHEHDPNYSAFMPDLPSLTPWGITLHIVKTLFDPIFDFPILTPRADKWAEVQYLKGTTRWLIPQRPKRVSITIYEISKAEYNALAHRGGERIQNCSARLGDGTGGEAGESVEEGERIA